MSVMWKIAGLVAIQYILNMVRVNVTRYVIKNFFTSAEFPLSQWFTPQFIMSLDVPKILGLFVIASFTLISFPLGIWIGSFTLGISEPVVSMVALSIGVFLLPIQLVAISEVVKEWLWNRETYTALVIVEASYVLQLVGWWLMSQGNQGLAGGG